MTDPKPLMAGKRGLVLGVANDRSLAWGIAAALHAHGAEIALTHQGEALGKRVAPLAEQIGCKILMDCDVADDSSMDAVFARIGREWGKMDFLVHAIAFSDREELKGDYVATTRRNFAMTLDVSCYSFTALAQRAVKLMPGGGGLLTLTYLGAERVMPHYNVMGVAKAALETSVKYLAADLGKRNVRVNAISAGPIRTLASAGIGDFRYILKWNEFNSPLRRNVRIDEVGGAALYLLSELSSGVTGEIHHVDAGYHVVGMIAVDAAPKVAEMLHNFKPATGG